MKIVIGCDHVGFLLKEPIKEFLIKKGYDVIDKGTYNTERVDYPTYGNLVAKAIIKNEADLGLLFCGTGVGISISANRNKGIRAVVCSEPYSAKLSREHNNSNILSLGSRVVGLDLAKLIVETWLEASFEGGRHQKRVNQIDEKL
ncbi:ribose-5-phosphate isomerase B [Spiroplasma helicoides]|uniref:Ribose-5-phosphate isomerase B n=1 Tax=Spiroplasma helicoides TaxID=216938 RepID=A0A1B3SLX7_9MOLU|nr:ribose 5-phosphate isomerase B [Spiroplasma helicoides]AOG60910.1 ribose-5-phosphate isomerase B [Spiroplasma helicoides]